MRELLFLLYAGVVLVGAFYTERRLLSYDLHADVAD